MYMNSRRSAVNCGVHATNKHRKQYITTLLNICVAENTSQWYGLGENCIYIRLRHYVNLKNRERMWNAYRSLLWTWSVSKDRNYQKKVRNLETYRLKVSILSRTLERYNYSCCGSVLADWYYRLMTCIPSYHTHSLITYYEVHWCFQNWYTSFSNKTSF